MSDAQEPTPVPPAEKDAAPSSTGVVAGEAAEPEEAPAPQEGLET
jgi:hypothetical protein